MNPMFLVPHIYIEIESGVDYSPATEAAPIHALHCLATNTKDVKVLPIYKYKNQFPNANKEKKKRESQWIVYPAGSFVRGVIYPGLIRKMEIDSEDSAKFIGYAAEKRQMGMVYPGIDG